MKNKDNRIENYFISLLRNGHSVEDIVKCGSKVCGEMLAKELKTFSRSKKRVQEATKKKDEILKLMKEVKLSKKDLK